MNKNNQPQGPPLILRRSLPQILDEMDENTRAAAEAARRAEEVARSAKDMSSKASDEIIRAVAEVARRAKEVARSAKNMPSKANWESIESELGITKNSFGRKINFVTDTFKREIIFRDVEDSFVLASSGFSKPAVILAGGVIEELLRLYLEHKGISPISKSFDEYIKTCEQEGLLKSGISRLSDSVRQFRNLVHLSAEKSKKYSISKATAKGAVSSIFTISNDF